MRHLKFNEIVWHQILTCISIASTNQTSSSNHFQQLEVIASEDLAISTSCTNDAFYFIAISCLKLTFWFWVYNLIVIRKNKKISRFKKQIIFRSKHPI